MPTVPIYDSPQVRPTGAPVPQLSVNVPNITGTIGAGMQEAVGTFANIQEKANREAAQQVVQEKLIELQRYRNGWDEQISTLDGEKIKNPEYYGGQEGESLSAARERDQQDQYQKLVEGMTPLQRKMFDAHAKPALEQDRMRTSLHEIQQIKKIQLNTKDAAIAVAGDTAEGAVDNNTGNFDWKKLDEAVTTARLASASKSQLMGLEGDLADLAEKDAVSSVVKRAANKLIGKSNSTDAQKLVESYTDILTPEVRDHFLAKAKGVNDDNMATNEARIARGLAFDESTGMFSYAKAQDYIERKDAAGNFVLAPEVRKAALGLAEHRIETGNADVKKKDAALLQPIYRQLLDGTGSQYGLTAAIRKITGLSPEAGSAMVNHISTWFAHRRAEAREAANPILSPMQQAQQTLEYYKTISRPDFAKMTEQDVLALVPTLGTKGTQQVMADLYAVKTTPEKINEIKLDNDVAEAAAKKFGIFSGDKPNDAEKLKIAQMQAQAKMIIQASGAKTWPYEQQLKLYETLASKVVTDRGMIWDTETPYYQLLINNPIPNAFLKTLEAEAKAQGATMPSGPRIYQLWFDARSKGLVDEKGNAVKKGQGAGPGYITGATK